MKKNELMKIQKNQYNGWFQKMAQGEIKSDSYEPLCLLLIPILLRTRQQYYDDAIRKTKKLIMHYWHSTKHLYHSYEQFEQDDHVQKTWERGAPLWWGINDIIGWIDVRVCVLCYKFQISLFLPTKRISKVLKDKQYYPHQIKRIELPQQNSNRKLQSLLLKGIEDISNNKTKKKVH